MERPLTGDTYRIDSMLQLDVPAARRAVLVLFPLALTIASADAQIDGALLAGMPARSIGPAGMSGRVTAIAAVESDPSVIWVGAATGGLWVSRDAGLTWKPLFDEQAVASIGAVAIFQESPDVVWVGTGEGNPRNSASVGNGVYRTLDGGKSWKHLGLASSERIHRILLDEHDPDVAWVAAMGPAWGDGEERGVWHTQDGGASWQRLLYVSASTGCADLAAAPGNPRRMLAAMWDYRRQPYSFRSGGPGSGLHLSIDGGATWKRLGEAEGLPAGELGRIGIAFAPSDPEIAYALVEAKKNVLLRSTDGGSTWTSVNESPDVTPRPFYFADVRVDPADPDRVYRLASLVDVSDDGGKSFVELVGWNSAHPDHHAFWIDPADPRHIVDGNDGGVSISRDRGNTWRFVRNLPLAQYYHVALDMEQPYHVYGGLQDNGSWRGPSSVWENGGIQNLHWREVAFGDGFATVPIAGDASKGYAMSQGGFLVRYDLATGERKSIRPDGPEGIELRFNWNAGIALDPFDANGVYYGSQFLHHSSDRGESWRLLSGDLTTNNPAWLKQAESGGLTPDVTGAENYETILTIAPSTLERGRIWVGTDDGRVQLTADGGASWTSLEERIHGAPRNAWVPHVEASRHSANRAWVLFDDHRRNDRATYVFRTDDDGQSWTSLVTGDLRGWAWCLEEDPVDPELLYLGTEFGLWISVDGGGHWTRWTHGLPTVAVSALTVHPREHDLVIATHGRAVHVLDDVRPLRELTGERLAEPLHLFEVPPAQQHVIAQAQGPRFTGSDEFRGANRPYGALITFSLGQDPPKPEPPVEGEEAEEPVKVRVKITSEDGALARELEAEPKRGIQRVVWDLRVKGPRRPGQGYFGDDMPTGPEALPGRYTVTVTYAGNEAVGALEVLADPRQTIAVEARAEKLAALEEAGRWQDSLTRAIERIDRLENDIERVLAKADEAKPDDAPKDAPHPHAALVESAKQAKKALAEEEKKLWHPPDTKGIPKDDRVQSLLDEAYFALASSADAPTPAQRIAMQRAKRALDEALAGLQRFLDEQVAPLRAKVEESGIHLLGSLDPDL